MLVRNSELMNGIMITPLLLFLLELDLVSTISYRFVKHTPVKCFRNFVHPVVGARGHGDENPNSSVAETRKLLANSSEGYQIKDQSHHSDIRITLIMRTRMQLSIKTVHESISYQRSTLRSKAELVRYDNEHKEPILAGFFNVQYAKLRLLKLCNIFFHRILRYNQLRRNGNQYRLSLFSIRKEMFIWSFSRRKKARVGTVAKQRL